MLAMPVRILVLFVLRFIIGQNGSKIALEGSIWKKARCLSGTQID